MLGRSFLDLVLRVVIPMPSEKIAVTLSIGGDDEASLSGTYTLAKLFPHLSQVNGFSAEWVR